MAKAVLITGSNMGESARILEEARNMIVERVGPVSDASTVMVSEPWGNVEPGKGMPETHVFLNQVLVAETDMPPAELLKTVLGIEEELGRERRHGDDAGGTGSKKMREAVYTSRTIDIDILFYDDMIIDTVELTIPHPLMTERAFVLKPLAEVMAEYVHPVCRKTIARLLEECNEKNKDM